MQSRLAIQATLSIVQWPLYQLLVEERPRGPARHTRCLIIHVVSHWRGHANPVARHRQTFMKLTNLFRLGRILSHCFLPFRNSRWVCFPGSNAVRSRAALSGLIFILLNAGSISSGHASNLRWHLLTDALSQVETECDPDAIGAQGEFTEYQIPPEIWIAECHLAGLRTNSHENRLAARLITWRLLSRRVTTYTEIAKRSPTPEEVYALWNSPAELVAKRCDWRSLSLPVKERCRRFARLYEALRQRERDSSA